MNDLKLKKGEWCFCEFKLQQVTDTIEDRITEVSDGMFRMGGYDLSDKCYPLEMTIKNISDTVNYWSKTFHEIKFNGLNHPDLNRELISRWIDMCQAKDDKDRLKQLHEKLAEFGGLVETKVSDIKNEKVVGINIFRT